MLIGIDLGGTNIAAGLVNDEGVLIEKMSILTNTSRSSDKIIKDIYLLIEKMIAKTTDKVKYIGIGIPGLVNKDMSLVLKCPNLNWENVPLMKGLEKLKIPIIIDNDANLAAYAEYKIGSLKNTKNSVVLTLGTGIGGGIIIDNKEFRGGYGLGSEIGHMVIGENFYDCGCGKNGCFETFASATAIIKYAEYLIKNTDKKSKLRDFKNITAKDVIELSKEKDEIALLTFNRFIKYLSIGIVNIINLIDPNKIALGGGISATGDYLLDNLNADIKKHLFLENYESAEIVIAELGNDAGIIGAALLAKDYYLK